jgi:hypothetical protein
MSKDQLRLVNYYYGIALTRSRLFIVLNILLP